jgi:hypothetical protein
MCRVLDACCSSGTIPRAAVEYKLASGIPSDQVAAGVFASDIDPQAVQLATFALAKPTLMNQPLRVFNRDAFTLTPNTTIEFRHPVNGTQFHEQLNQFHAIAGNLPFIGQAGRPAYTEAIEKVNQLLSTHGGALKRKADIAAYFPFALHELLEPGGRLGIIITNSWLGTDWGADFFQKLRQFYNVKAVITSGAGRWFQNSQVVTNILVLEKPAAGQTVSNETINFVVLKRRVEELTDNQTLDNTAAQIEVGQSHDDTMTIRRVSPDSLEEYRRRGLCANAQFVDVEWTSSLPLVPVKSLFEMGRGERRGRNALFYPAAEHGIEHEYIQPLLKSPRDIQAYTTSAQKEAFSCSLSLDELQRLRHTGALAWIKRFENTRNGRGQLLSESLGNSRRHWYEMRTDALKDMVMSINPGNRLFVARLDPPAFVDQRFTYFKAKNGVDLDLCHALLNCTIGLFMIEGIGFGRALGALDLNKDTVEEFMHMLNPAQLADSSKLLIKQAFEPIKNREIREVADELEQADRQNLDDVVINAFGLNIARHRIYESLLNLISIRQSVHD